MSGSAGGEGTGSRWRGGAGAFASLFAIAFLLRIGCAARLSAMYDDGPRFLALAARLRAGDWDAALSHVSHPLYPFLISLAPGGPASFESAAVVWSVLGGSLAVLALFALMRALFDRRTAWVAALLLAISPYGVRFSADVQSEGVYLAFFLAALWLLWRGFAAGRGSLLLAAGALAGLAYLTRPEGAVVVASGVVFGGWRIVRADRPPVAGLGDIAFLLLGAGVVAGPYLAAIQVGDGGLEVSSKKSLSTLIGLSDAPFHGPPILSSIPLEVWVGLALLIAGAIAWVMLRRRDAAAVLGMPSTRHLAVASIAIAFIAALLWPDSARELFDELVSTLRPEGVALIGVGIWAARERPDPARRTFIAVVITIYLLILMGLVVNYGYLSRRHVLPASVLLLGYAGLGCDFLARRLRMALARGERDRSPISERLSFALVILALIVIALPKTLRDHRLDALAQRRAAEWLRAEALEPGALAAEKLRVAYYADRDWRALTNPDGVRPLPQLEAEGVRFVVVDDRMLEAVSDTIDDGRIGLEELHRVEAGGRLAIVYELRPLE